MQSITGRASVFAAACGALAIAVLLAASGVAHAAETECAGTVINLSCDTVRPAGDVARCDPGEPVLALDGGPDGLGLIRRLLAGLPGVLAPGGMALLEIGSDQGASAPAEAAARLPDWAIRVHPDLGGRPRVLALTAPSSIANG